MSSPVAVTDHLTYGLIMEDKSPLNYLHHDQFPGLEPVSSHLTLLHETEDILSSPFFDPQILEVSNIFQFSEMAFPYFVEGTYPPLPATSPDSLGQYLFFDNDTSLAPSMSTSSAVREAKIAEVVTLRTEQRICRPRKKESRQRPQRRSKLGAKIGAMLSHDRLLIRRHEKNIERNRQAARRYREKCNHQNAALESKSKEESAHNSGLLADTNLLRFELFNLRNEILSHSHCQDEQIQRQLAKMVWDISGRDDAAILGSRFSFRERGIGAKS